MQIELHKNATTTLKISQEIKETPLSAYALAKKYGINQTTAQRWKKAESLLGKSFHPIDLGLYSYSRARRSNLF